VSSGGQHAKDGGAAEQAKDVNGEANKLAEIPPELSADELKKMSKAERTAYHVARRNALAASKTAAPVSKKEKKEAARQKQEADTKKKEDALKQGSEDITEIKELRLQGLTEEQAKEVCAQLKNATEALADDGEEEESLFQSVQTWMAEHDQEVTDGESLHDFNMKVRFQGHPHTTPPDHLGAILEVLSSKAFLDFELKTAKRPDFVAEKVKPLIQRWSYLLGELYKKCDVLAASNILVSSLDKGVQVSDTETPEVTKACVVVGFLMAVREEMEAIEDEELLTGCRHLETNAQVMTKFIEFLEDECEGDDESDDEDGS